MLELSDREFKITMINMLKDLLEKVGIIQEQMGNVAEEDKNSKTGSKGNVRNQKYCSRNE